MLRRLQGTAVCITDIRVLRDKDRPEQLRAPIRGASRIVPGTSVDEVSAGTKGVAFVRYSSKFFSTENHQPV